MKSFLDQQNKVRDVLSQYIYQDKWIGTKKLDKAVKLIMEIFSDDSLHIKDDVITKFPWENI